MERVHYRRTTSSAGRPAERSGFRDKLITQAIVSGMVLALVLTARVFHNPFFAKVESGIEKAFAGYTQADVLIADLQSAAQNLFSPEEKAVASEPPAESLLGESPNDPAPEPSPLPGP